LVDAVAGGLQLSVERAAIGEMQDLRHRRLVAAFAFTRDQPLGAAKGAKEIRIDAGVGQLQGPRAGGIRFLVGHFEVGRGVGDTRHGVEQDFRLEPPRVVPRIEPIVRLVAHERLAIALIARRLQD